MRLQAHAARRPWATSSPCLLGCLQLSSMHASTRTWRIHLQNASSRPYAGPPQPWHCITACCAAYLPTPPQHITQLPFQPACVPAALQVEQFVAQEYWSIDVAVGLDGKATQLPARLTHLDGSKVQQMSISNEDQASEVAGRVRAASYTVRRCH